MSGGDVIERLSAICAAAGFDLAGVEPPLLTRMRLLAEYTETVADCERLASMAHAVFRHHQATKPGEAFSESERRIVVLGCLFADIGKSGPAHADAGGQRLIAKMFAVEGVRDDKQTVTQFLSAHFPADAGERTRQFAALGLDPGMTLREFWNLHSTWTLQIVEAGGVPLEAIAAAASHHLLDDVNPGSIVGPDRKFTRSFGDNAAFDRAEKLITVLDKYDALRRRGRRTHGDAIAWIRDKVESNPHFRGDPEFTSLIADLDAALGASEHPGSGAGEVG